MLVVFFKVSSLKLVMVSLLLLSRSLRKEGNNKKNRKRRKRNEIQCMILLRSLIFGSTKSEICSEKDFKYLTTNKILPSISIKLIIVEVCFLNFSNSQYMEQLELFNYRRDYLFKSENQIAYYFDILKETDNEISYSEHINPKKGFAIAGMEYEQYIDVKKNRLNGLTYDQILTYLKNAKKEDRLEKLKTLLKFRNISFDADLFTWHNEDIN